MTATAPVTAGTDAPGLLDALRRAGLGDVDDSGLARALYSSDASLYRVLPRAVVRPRDVDEVLATLAVCRELGVPLTARGAGTSIAGNAVGPGVVLDTSRHLNRVTAIDADVIPFGDRLFLYFASRDPAGSIWRARIAKRMASPIFATSIPSRFRASRKYSR